MVYDIKYPLSSSSEVLVGTRALNLDNVGPSGELHTNVKELFNVLLLFLR